MIHARSDKQEDGMVNARADAPGNHWLCEACANACLAILPPQTFCITCLKGKLMDSSIVGVTNLIFVVPYAIFVSPPMAHKKRIVSEGFRRGVLSMGGAEYFTSANLVAHVNYCHIHLRKQPLRIEGQVKKTSSTTAAAPEQQEEAARNKDPVVKTTLVCLRTGGKPKLV